MRISDWSSDVCSSDLSVQFDQPLPAHRHRRRAADQPERRLRHRRTPFLYRRDGEILMRRANKRALRAATGPVKAMAGAVLLTLAGCAAGQAVAGAAPHGEATMEQKLFAGGVKRLHFRNQSGKGWGGGRGGK